MRIVSVITARGGSKGIPKKNITDLNGNPLLYYSIMASVGSRVGKTFVSTDDKEISDIALNYRVSVIDRPKNLSNDIIMPDNALLHFAKMIDFDILVFIQPTSPMITSKYINSGIDMLISNSYDSVFTATREHWLPKWTTDVKPVDWDIHNRPRRQDKEDLYSENGMFYITTRECLLSNSLRYGGKMGIVDIPLKDSFQVDTVADLELIRKII